MNKLALTAAVLTTLLSGCGVSHVAAPVMARASALRVKSAAVFPAHITLKDIQVSSTQTVDSYQLTATDGNKPLALTLTAPERTVWTPGCGPQLEPGPVTSATFNGKDLMLDHATAQSLAAMLKSAACPGFSEDQQRELAQAIVQLGDR